MKKRRYLRRSFLAAYLVANLFPLGSVSHAETVTTCPNRLEAGDKLISFSFQSRSRSYLLHVDSNYDPAKPAEVVFAFHGGFGDACDMPKATGLNNIAARVGLKNRPFIVVYPNGVSDRQVYGDSGQHWNDGRVDLGAGDIDDVGFVHAIIERLSKTHKLKINKKRIFAIGVSNGGMFAYRLAQESNRIAGAVAISALLPKRLLSTPQFMNYPVPVLIVVGTDDDRMPYGGGAVNSQIGGDVLSASETFKTLVKRIGSPASVSETLDSSTLSTGIQKIVWRHQVQMPSEYRKHAHMEMISIHGGGHCWPGPQSNPNLSGTGKCATNFDASEEAMLFFDQQPDLKLSVWTDYTVGGGGAKEAFAYSLGFKKTDSLEYDLNLEASNGYRDQFLIDNNVALIFVQGLALKATPGSYPWSNTIVNSGRDDKAMLISLAKSLRDVDGFS